MRDEWSQTQSFVTFNLSATSSAVRRGSLEGLRPTVRGGVSDSMVKLPWAGLVSGIDSNLPGFLPSFGADASLILIASSTLRHLPICTSLRLHDWNAF